jgi:hypothetical protein
MPKNKDSEKKSGGEKSVKKEKKGETRVRKKAAAKKAATKKATVRKKAASPSAGSKRKTARSTSHQAKGSRTRSSAAAPGDRQKMIAEAAYYRWLARGQRDGNPDGDWIAAEREIDRLHGRDDDSEH